MTTYAWPTLPKPNKGFSESRGMNILRTPMDAGPAKVRKRSNRPSTMGVEFLLTTAQVTTLENFVFNTILGVYPFEFTHPRTDSTVTCRIISSSDGELYKITYVAPGFWSVSLQFEILP